MIGDTAAPVAQSHKNKKVLSGAAANAAANKAAAEAAATAAATTAQVDADVIIINIPSLPEKDIAVGPVRHRLCEPLFKGTKQSGGDTVWEAIGRAVDGPTMSPADKMSAWEGIGVVGELARIKCELRSFRNDQQNES